MVLVPRILWLKWADCHLLALVSEMSAEISSPNTPLLHFPAVFLFFFLWVVTLCCVSRTASVQRRCTKLFCTIVRKQPCDHLFHVCLDSKWGCHLHLIVHLQRAKSWKTAIKHSWLTVLNTLCFLCIENEWLHGRSCIKLHPSWKKLPMKWNLNSSCCKGLVNVFLYQFHLKRPITPVFSKLQLNLIRPFFYW